MTPAPAALTTLLPVLVLLPLLGAALLVVVGRRADRWAAGLGVAVQALGVLAAAAAASVVDRRGGRTASAVDIAWIRSLDVGLRLGLDGLSVPLVLLTAVLGLLTVVAVWRRAPAPGHPRALVGVLLLLQAGLQAAFLAQDLVLFFVAFELVLAPMWFLIAVWGSGDKRRAANVFILFTVTGSVVMLAGILVVVLAAGSADLAVLTTGRSPLSHHEQLVGGLLIAVGLLVKTPMWPLHSWLPDAHSAAPTVGSVLLAGVLLKLGTYGLVRIVLPVTPDAAARMAPYLAAFAVVGICYGAWASYAQTDVKRLVAFSSVGHMGFVLLGIASLTGVGVNGAMFGNIAHGVITGLLFFVVGGLKDRYGTTSMAELPHGLYGSLPRVAAVLALASFASLGLPGLAGFWGELLALFGAYRSPADVLLFRVLMVVAALGTVLTAAYFLRVLRRLGQGRPGSRRKPDLTRREAVTWLPLAAATVLLGLLPGPLLAVTAPTVAESTAPAAAARGDD